MLVTVMCLLVDMGFFFTAAWLWLLIEMADVI
jgi:hypothetical protein